MIQILAPWSVDRSHLCLLFGMQGGHDFGEHKKMILEMFGKVFQLVPRASKT